MYEPLYGIRYNIVNAVSEEVDGVAKVVKANKEADEGIEVKKGVPDFWLSAMKTNEVLRKEIRKHDEGALKNLKGIRKLTQGVLTKTYHVLDDEELFLQEVIGTGIEWNHGKNMKQKQVAVKRKRGSNEGTIHVLYCKCFFNSEYDYELDKEAAVKIQNKIAQDYDIGSTIRDNIVPHAVPWFTEEAT
ncbi:hypothetical protein C5167_004537, partial [Papaver somniferum]